MSGLEVVWCAVLRRLPNATEKAAAMLCEPTALPRYWVIETRGGHSIAYDPESSGPDRHAGPLSGRKVENLIRAVYDNNSWDPLPPEWRDGDDRGAIREAVLAAPA